MKFTTKAIHVGNTPNFKAGGTGDVIVPIHLSTTFARKRVYAPTAGYDYSRSGNPTRHALEKNLASLEHGKYAFAYASGLAAITNVLLLLKPGDHVIGIDNLYGGTYRLFSQVFAQWGIQLSLVNFTDGDSLVNYIRPNTKCIWLESPTNPLLKIVDLKSVSTIAKKKGILTVIDNTFATPCWQQPLDLDIDIVIHSATKYLGGHSDVTAGCVITKNKTLGKRLGFLQNAVGAILSPFDSYALLKGIKTLSVRMEKHGKNTKEVVAFLSKHKKIKKIYYPGLLSHPQHAIAKKQMQGFGAMVSFELHGTIQTAITFMESLKLIHIAISLGAVESLIEHPASMTHASVPKKEREKCGLFDTLIRLSVGIEDVDDIIADLSQALKKAN
ncbi:MAG: PLP-dependent transferase [Candidatus Levybacteria bacterium]|nr:PLP-dependent transferase [Candidatus Levybacteria bacterium]